MDNQMFTMMRFNVLSASLTAGPRECLDDAYVFAWDKKVYPYLHEGASWHKPFARHFDVTEEMMVHLFRVLTEKSNEKHPMTFHDLENHYGVNYLYSAWNRVRLIDACQYVYLLGDRFDEAFWLTLSQDENSPAEAHYIMSPYDRGRSLAFR